MNNDQLRIHALESFDYVPEFGELVWRKSRGNKKAGEIAGSYESRGYKKVGFMKKNRKVHRLIFLMIHGFCPTVIDHVNGDISDNRIGNLREASSTENSFNRKLNLNSTTGLKGVWKVRDKWRATITCTTKINLGYFDSPVEAANAYDAAAVLSFGEFAKTNKSMGLI